MVVENPPFVIPKENSRSESKSGGGNPPKFIGDINQFEEHRRQRVSEVDEIISFLEAKESIISAPDERIFYEVEFHRDALSKSAQPKHLFDLNNIDIYAQTSENTFLASSLEENLRSFRNSITSINLGSNKNESAYLSAVSKIKNISKKEKLSGDVEGRRFEGYLFISDVMSVEEAKKIAATVKEKSSARNFSFFVSSADSKVIYGNFPSKFIEEISEPDPRNPIVSIEKAIRFFTSQTPSSEYLVGDINVEEPDLDARIGILDSGLKVGSAYRSLVLGNENFIKSAPEEDPAHGTFVATRAIFGNDIETQIREGRALKAKARVLNIQVMRKGNTDEQEIVKAIKKIVTTKKYSDIKIFNLSINNNDWQATLANRRSFITRELDAIAYKYGVCFFSAAGNHSNFRTEKYPECLFVQEALIGAPADIINGLSVGSITDTDSSRAVALNNEPSPFTRTGMPDSKKPDLVHFGGNCDVYSNPAGIGVKGFSILDGKINEDIGTSFAAPLASQVAAQIYAYLKANINPKAPLIDLTKALTLHSGSYSLPPASTIDEKSLKHTVGFGIPDTKRALDSIKSSATFIYWDTIGRLEKSGKKVVKLTKHKIKFIVPKELEGKGKKVRVKGTLVYTPLVSPTGQVDYCLADIECNIHYKNSHGTEVGGALSQTREDNRGKWSPIKSFEKIFTAYKGGEWEVWLTLTARGKADTDDYLQDYAFVVSVEDATTDPEKRIDLHSVIREQHKSYLPVGLRVRERTRVGVSRV